MDEAAETAIHHIAMNTGQVCSAATRVLIPESMKGKFEKALLNALPKFTVGDPREDHATGPLVSKSNGIRCNLILKKESKKVLPFLLGNWKARRNR